MPSFLDRLADGHLLLTDGAIGTNFQEMGLAPGVAPEEWFRPQNQETGRSRYFLRSG
jgi:hypothetical protein